MGGQEQTYSPLEHLEQQNHWEPRIRDIYCFDIFERHEQHIPCHPRAIILPLRTAPEENLRMTPPDRVLFGVSTCNRCYGTPRNGSTDIGRTLPMRRPPKQRSVSTPAKRNLRSALVAASSSISPDNEERRKKKVAHFCQCEPKPRRMSSRASTEPVFPTSAAADLNFRRMSTSESGEGTPLRCGDDGRGDISPMLTEAEREERDQCFGINAGSSWDIQSYNPARNEQDAITNDEDRNDLEIEIETASINDNETVTTQSVELLTGQDLLEMGEDTNEVDVINSGFEKAENDVAQELEVHDVNINVLQPQYQPAYAPSLKIHEWSGEVSELPSITEEEFHILDEAVGMLSTTETLTLDQKRRSSDTPVSVSNTACSIPRRTVSMTELRTRRDNMRGRHPQSVSGKAAPAGTAVSACSVRALESPPLDSLYPNSRPKHGKFDHTRDFTVTAQTIQSKFGTCQMMWEEPTCSSSGSTVAEEEEPSADDPCSDDLDSHILRLSNPLMENLKIKLTAWTWERDRAGDAEERAKWLPLMSMNDQRPGRSSGYCLYPESPHAPPNTERQSGQSSAKHSTPQTPIVEEVDSEEEAPFELKFRTHSASSPALHSARDLSMTGDYVTVPRRLYSMQVSQSIPHQSSSLTDDDMDLQSHRDSVDLSRHEICLQETKGQMNQHLMHARDSIVLAKVKFDAKRLRSLGNQSAICFGGPSPILDASPPTTRGGWLQEGRRAGPAPLITPSTEDHPNCSICEMERPRWYEKRYREW